MRRPLRHFFYAGPRHARFSWLQQAFGGYCLQQRRDQCSASGLAERSRRLPRRSLIVLFTDFVDTVTSELLLENVRRIAARHLLIFVTIRDSLLSDIFEAPPTDTKQMARAVLAADFNASAPSCLRSWIAWAYSASIFRPRNCRWRCSTGIC